MGDSTLDEKAVNAMKVAELKAELKARGLPVSGRKAELQAALLAALTEAAPAAAPTEAAPAAAAAASSAQAAPSKKRKHSEAEEEEEEEPKGKKETEKKEKTAAAAADTQPAKKMALDAAASTAPSTKIKTEPKEEEVVEDDIAEERKPPKATATTPASSARSAPPKATATTPASSARPAPPKPEPKPEPAAEADDGYDYDELDAIKADKPDASMSYHCPYLDTINRNILDFDFEKLCSVTMSNLNIYACLVCGKYFQGRGPKTHAHTHSVECGHHVFLNLGTLEFYCLPDNYRVIDPSLEDIKFYLKPTFTPEQIANLDTNAKVSRALDGTTYLPGVVGLNNMKANDYVNVSLQALCRVPPFRDFFLREENYEGITDPLVTTMGELMRKMCNPRNFKSHVSPHEFLQAVSNASKKQFRIVQQSDPMDFITWLLTTLIMKLGSKRRKCVTRTFQGKLRMWEKLIPPTESQAMVDGIKVDPSDPKYRERCHDQKFMYLALDLPPAPLFQDGLEQNIIPQVPLFELLNKFDGVTEKEYKTYKTLETKRFSLLSLPNYVIVCIKRFTKNYSLDLEKNPTVVNFPVKNIVLKDYLLAEGDEEILGDYKYDLLANIVHDGQPGAGKGTYRVHVLHKGAKQWFELQDLHVTEILPQMITLSESYIQVWERQPDATPEEKAAEAAALAARMAAAESAVGSAGIKKPAAAAPAAMDESK